MSKMAKLALASHKKARALTAATPDACVGFAGGVAEVPCAGVGGDTVAPSWEPAGGASLETLFGGRRPTEENYCSENPGRGLLKDFPDPITSISRTQCGTV